jgi:hypothetical protein
MAVWAPATVLRVADAIREALADDLTAEPDEDARLMFIVAAAQALQYIGGMLGPAAGIEIHLPDPQDVSPRIEIVYKH